ncbi:PDIA5, partial [Cervus elaphus hippelaphus]
MEWEVPGKSEPHTGTGLLQSPRADSRRTMESLSGCPHCKKVIPHFTATADAFKDDRKIACVAIDCVKEKNKDLCQQEAVKGYPTFHYYNYGKFVEKYDTNPTELGFTNFIRTLREGDHERLGKKKEELSTRSLE